MHRRLSFILVVALALALATAVSAPAAPTAVDVRIEGRTSTIFDGPVTTDGKQLTTQKGGTHRCDGTNGGANPSPGPTPTTALDDVSAKGGFSWDGPYFSGFEDFLVERVAGDANTTSEFWGVFVNNVAPEVGGCQFRLEAGDEVLWTFDAFSKQGLLTATGPGAGRTGQPIEVRVVDARTGAPQAGATVGEATTGLDGVARLAFEQPGVYRLKAEKAAYVRSRALTICIDPPLVEACTSTDRTPPAVRLDAPAVASDVSRYAIKLSWQGDDGPAGSGVRRYRVDVRRPDRGETAWRPLASDTTATERLVRGSSGAAYDFRVRAFDRAGNASGEATATTLMPVDDLSHRIRFSRGWKVLKRSGAWRRAATRSTRRGASATMRFSGTQALLISRKLPRGGRLRVTIDGRSHTVSLRGRSRFRRVVFRSPQLRPGAHRLRVRALGRAPVEVDALAVRPGPVAAP